MRGLAGLEVAQEQLVIALVVARRLGERDAIVLHIGQAHAEVVGLHALVARAFFARAAVVQIAATARSIDRPSSHTDRRR